MSIDLLNKILSTLTLGAHIGIVLFITLYLVSHFSKKKLLFFEKIKTLTATNGLMLGFLVAIISTALSLFYSEILHLPPCSMCWYQRIFIFPQVFILGMAYVKKDQKIADYSIFLALVGALLAIYHILLQNGISLYTPCSVGALVSCSEKLFTYYGYITLPVMSLTSFVLLGIAMYLVKEKK